MTKFTSHALQKKKGAVAKVSPQATAEYSFLINFDYNMSTRML